MIEKQVRESAYHIINSKGSTYFAVGLALVKITASILRKQKSVSQYLHISMVNSVLRMSASVFRVLFQDNGIEKIIDHKLADDELALLRHSAFVLRQAIDSLNNE